MNPSTSSGYYDRADDYSDDDVFANDGRRQNSGNMGGYSSTDYGGGPSSGLAGSLGHGQATSSAAAKEFGRLNLSSISRFCRWLHLLATILSFLITHGLEHFNIVHS